jgi:hypothetical protein
MANSSFLSLIKNPLKFRLFLLTNLPAAYFSGLRITEMNDERCTVAVPFKWFTKNPFRSTYFACLSMAAEMSTGVLAMANIYQRLPKVSMLVIGSEAKFYKRATGLSSFTCKEGLFIKESIQNAIDLSEPQTVQVRSSGYNDAQELIAEFWFTWSFKAR